MLLDSIKLESSDMDEIVNSLGLKQPLICINRISEVRTIASRYVMYMPVLGSIYYCSFSQEHLKDSLVKVEHAIDGIKKEDAHSSMDAETEMLFAKMKAAERKRKPVQRLEKKEDADDETCE